MIVKEIDSFLVVIDSQERLISAMSDSDQQMIIDQTSILLQAANLLDVPITITEQYPKGLGPTHPDLLNDVSSPTIIEKTCFSCSDQADFMARLRSSHRRSVILTGMEAHICVLQTALKLKSQGFDVFVVEDAVCSRTEKNKDNALQRLAQAGVVICNTESVLFEWLQDAKHEHFRTLSKLIV